MKVGIYVRLSKEDDDVRKQTGTKQESESIQNQKSLLIQYAVERGYDIYNIYTDEDYSGADRDRPAFNRLIQDASEHKFDIVLAKSQSRFTRDMELVERYCTASSRNGASALLRWWIMRTPTTPITRRQGRSTA